MFNGARAHKGKDMSARSVSLGSMFTWIGDSLRLLGRNFLTLIGASGLTLLLGILLFLPMLVIVIAFMPAGFEAGLKDGSLPAGKGMALFYSSYAITIIAALFLLPPLLVGWNRLCRDLDLGHAASALDILRPYKDGPVWIRSLGFALLAVAMYVLVIGLFGLAFFGAISEFMQQVAAQQAAALAGAAPAPPGISPVLVLAYFVFIGAIVILQIVHMVGFVEISLRDTSVIGAMARGLGGVLRNALKLLVFLFCVCLLAGIVLVVIAMVLGLAFWLLTLLSPTLATIVGVILYVPFMLCIYPLIYASHYFVWKSMLGDDSPARPDADDAMLPA
jgi:hypothetical protein